MRSDDIFRRIAPYFGIAGGILLFVAAGAFLVIGSAPALVIWLLIAAALLLVFFVAADPDRVLDALSGRQVRYGTNAGVLTVAFLGIFVLANFVGVQRNQQWDVTANQANSISPATVKLVSALTQPVQIIGFFGQSQQGDGGKAAAQKLLTRYTDLNKLITVTYVDPFADPAQAQKYKVTTNGSLVVISGARQQVVTFADEQSLTSAIQKVTSGETPKVYVTQGNGEPSLDASGSPSFSQMAAFLGKNNYDVLPLNLLSVKAIPADTAALMIASPTVALGADQQKMILDYLNAGGRVLVFAGPFPKADLNWITKPYGVSIDGGIVADLSSSAAQLPVQAVLIQGYQQGPMISSPLLPSVLLDSTGLTVASPPPAGVTLASVAASSANSYEVMDPNATQVDPAKDKKGPFTLVVSAEKPVAGGASAQGGTGPSARLVVVGSSAFAADSLQQQSSQIAEGNNELAAAAVSWLTERSSTIIIPSKSSTDRSMLLGDIQEHILEFGSIVFAPLLVLLVGAAVWYRRR